MRKLSLLPAALAALVAVGATSAHAAPVPKAEGSQAAAAVTTARLAGADRYKTAVAISKANFVAPQQYVVVASGQAFPDALAAGPMGAVLEAPMLLVPRAGTLPAAVAAELDRLKAEVIIIAGGPAAVSDSMAAQLDRHASTDTFRVAGPNRFATAAELSTGYEPAITGVTVFLASGTNFPDALGGGAGASREGGFMLLTNPTVLPAETKTALRNVKPSKIYVLGGTAAVSNGVVSSVKATVPGVPVTRLPGKDRFATAALVSRNSFGSANEVFLANGLNYPDALAGGAVSPYFGGRPLLLTRQDCVPAATRAEITRLGATKVIALGGPAAVSDAALALKPC